MMQTERRQQQRSTRQSFYLKCGAALLLLLLSVLVIACGTSSTTTTANLSNPQVTVTINFSNNLSSLGTVAPYLCGAWVTNTTPAFNAGDKVPVYARFIHNVNGSPVGVGGAGASATVEWADGGSDTQSTTTTSDGLAVFYFTIPNQPDMVGRNNLVVVSFSAPNGQMCSVDNQPQPAAFFTLIAASPTPTAAPSPTAGDIQIPTPVGVPPPFFTPLGGGGQPTPTPTPCASIFGCG
jgi:hypothetical protein